MATAEAAMCIPPLRPPAGSEGDYLGLNTMRAKGHIDTVAMLWVVGRREKGVGGQPVDPLVNGSAHNSDGLHRRSALNY